MIFLRRIDKSHAMTQCMAIFKRLHVYSFTFSFLFLMNVIPTFATEATKATSLVEWNTPESRKRFARSVNVDFFTLSNNFESQDNALFCGPASAAIVLNSFKLRSTKEIPSDESSIAKNERKNLPKDFNPFLEKFTQNNVINSKSKSRAEILGKPVKIADKEVNDFGFQLKQMAQLLEANGVKAVAYAVSNETKDSDVKKAIIDNLKTENDYVLVNYARKTLGQAGGGHISPVGAYDSRSDSFLVMDVNTHKAPWVWVKSSDLISAMRTFDTVENRGYILVSN